MFLGEHSSGTSRFLLCTSIYIYIYNSCSLVAQSEAYLNVQGMTSSEDECPKTLLSRFLNRYYNREIRNGVDFKYFGRKCAEGWAAGVTVRDWSDEAYWGHPCHDWKAAEAAAARCFLSDPQVVEAAAHLPPPPKLVRRYFRSMIIASEVHKSDEERTEEIAKLTREYHLSCSLWRCRNSDTNGRAWQV